MSRTKKKYRDYSGDWRTIIKEGSDSKAKFYNSGKIPPHKLTPYTKGFKFKYTVSTGAWNGWLKGVTKQDKLITKNANRSMKKALRQFYKQQIKKELNDSK